MTVCDDLGQGFSAPTGRARDRTSNPMRTA